MCVKHDQADPAEVPVDQAAEELGPERFVLRITNINTQHFSVSVSTEPGGDHNSFGDNLASLTDMDVGPTLSRVVVCTSATNISPSYESTDLP